MMWAWDLTVTLGTAGSKGSWISRALDDNVHWARPLATSHDAGLLDAIHWLLHDSSAFCAFELD